MTSTTTAISESTAIVAIAVPSATAAPVEKVPRKFPPPCWTQEETVALIEAYRERWYALRRGYLRTADWDAVATAVGQRCPDASPAKTSAQCRHKMEKLRQRYRAEKQRSLAYPAGRFFSSWFFFENMDAMENGTTVSTVTANQENPGNAFGLKSLLDQNIMKLKLNPKKFDEELDPRFNISNMKNDVKLNPNYGSKVINNGYNTYMDTGSDKDEEEVEDGVNYRGGYQQQHMKQPPIIEMKAQKFRTLFSGGVKNELDMSNGFNMRNSSNTQMLPPNMRGKRFAKIDRKYDGEGGGEDDGYWVKMGNDQNVMPQGSRGNGYSRSGGIEKAKRVRDPVEEMVSSIKMLGEGFMRMEQMKMDMAREMEKMRMDMEMKRNEMLLESQKQIMDAFVKGLTEFKNKKVKKTLPSES